ncbi:hypothetical protein P261_02167 [Lachnospiraceae bacterium TWA4]|nr:hypothetical protein P261_02167 [Lachnospiraceae bacterium TWA4]
MVAVNGDSKSAISNVKTIMYIRPLSSALKCYNDTKGVTFKYTVDWKKLSDSAKVFLCRKNSKGKYEEIVEFKKAHNTKKSESYTYTDKKVSSGKNYSYGIKIKDGSYSSDYKYTSALYLQTPTLKRKTLSKNRVKIECKKVSGADGYMVHLYENGKSVSTVKIKTSKAFSYTYTDKGKNYHCGVYAYKASPTLYRSAECVVTKNSKYYKTKK